ncbi:MAG: amino acid permease, partial [Deltaproteobacteria bacterium]|nr:amino acid permease [Deltaproteobacteria bacterium]
MSKDGVFFELFGKVNKIRRTPAYSIFLQAGIAIVMVITATFDKLLLYIGFTLSLFAMLTVLGMMVLRIREPDLVRKYKTFGYPVTYGLSIFQSRADLLPPFQDWELLVWECAFISI